jgi:hypothetical protein
VASRAVELAAITLLRACSSHQRQVGYLLTPARLSRTWFELTGCRKRRSAAIRAGVATITDVDGKVITLS